MQLLEMTSAAAPLHDFVDQYCELSIRDCLEDKKTFFKNANILLSLALHAGYEHYFNDKLVPNNHTDYKHISETYT